MLTRITFETFALYFAILSIFIWKLWISLFYQQKAIRNLLLLFYTSNIFNAWKPTLTGEPQMSVWKLCTWLSLWRRLLKLQWLLLHWYETLLLTLELCCITVNCTKPLKWLLYYNNCLWIVLYWCFHVEVSNFPLYSHGMCTWIYRFQLSNR